MRRLVLGMLLTLLGTTAEAQVIEYDGRREAPTILAGTVPWAEAPSGPKSFSVYCYVGSAYVVGQFGEDVYVALNGHTASFSDVLAFRSAAGRRYRLIKADWANLQAAGIVGTGADVYRGNSALSDGLALARKKPECRFG